jgi:general secretion pathway protein K
MIRRGFALMAALWLLVAISTVSLELGNRARAKEPRQRARITRAAAAAESESSTRGHLVRMIGEGGATAETTSAPADAGPGAAPADAGAEADDAGAEADDAGAPSAGVGPDGKVILNLATEDDLRAFLTAKAIDVVSVDGLAEAILDWRDADDSRRPHGAERDDYLKAGTREIPQNGPFESINELRFVRGMTPAILSKIRGELTVFGSGQVNVNSAGGRAGVDPRNHAARGRNHHSDAAERSSNRKRASVDGPVAATGAHAFRPCAGRGVATADVRHA